MMPTEQILANSIKTAFCLHEDIVPDQFISSNTDILGLNEEVDYFVYMPSYMLWCLKNRHNQGCLVFDYTINALAEFGRCKNPQISHLNFKLRCNDRQKQVVLEFLVWCRSNLIILEKQLDRTIKNWGKP